MLGGLTLDSPLQVSSEVFQICCPQRSEDTEILLIYRLQLKSWSCWNPWQTSQSLQSGLDSTLTGQIHLMYTTKDQWAHPACQKLVWSQIMPIYFVLSYFCAHTRKGRIFFLLQCLIVGKIIFTHIIITEEIFSLCCRYKGQLKIILPLTTF